MFSPRKARSFISLCVIWINSIVVAESVSSEVQQALTVIGNLTDGLRSLFLPQPALQGVLPGTALQELDEDGEPLVRMIGRLTGLYRACMWQMHVLKRQYKLPIKTDLPAIEVENDPEAAVRKRAQEFLFVLTQVALSVHKVFLSASMVVGRTLPVAARRRVVPTPSSIPEQARAICVAFGRNIAQNLEWRPLGLL